MIEEMALFVSEDGRHQSAIPTVDENGGEMEDFLMVLQAFHG